MTVQHQIVETEHLMLVLLEQRDGLTKRIFDKAPGVDNRVRGGGLHNELFNLASQTNECSEILDKL